MDNTHSINKNVGIFWNAENLQNEIDHSIAEIVIRIGQSIGHENKINTAKIIGGYLKVNARMKEILNGMGFELFESFLSSADIDPDVLMLCAILTWLWDYDSINPSNFSNCVVIVSPSLKLSGLLKSLQERNVYVVVVTDITTPGHSIWKDCSDKIYDLHNLIEKQHFQIASVPTIKKSSHLPSSMPINQNLFSKNQLDSLFIQESDSVLPPDLQRYFNSTNSSLFSQSILPPAARAIEPPSLPTSQFRQTEHDISRLPMSYVQGNFDYGKDDEQLQLHEELKQAYQTQNVQATVSLLRKIYTKQYKTFRIPTLLASIPQRHAFQTDCIFILGCINWCFGGQKGSNTEAFTYKMNRNVARWLLKDIQRREVPVRTLLEVGNTVVTTVQSILNQVPEFDLMFETLQWVGRQDLDTILVPYINTWSMSSNVVQVKKARDFANELRRHMDLNQPPPPPTALSAMTPTIAALPPGLNTVRRARPDFPLSTPLSMPHMSMPHHLRQIPSMSTSSYSSNGIIGGGLSPFHLADTAATAQTPKTMESYLANASMLHDLNVVRDRLYALLGHFPSGILGARIPEIYQIEYQQSLQLYGKKLKDILLGFPDVEMVGIGGPGDKMFRIVRREQRSLPYGNYSVGGLGNGLGGAYY